MIRELDADVVVIGSGAGGATVAAECAAAGRRVVVLEEGPHVPPAEHAKMRPSQSLRHVWRDGGMTVAVGVGDTPMINVTMGKVVGGSSAITGGVCLRPPEHVLHRWAHERGLAELTPEAFAPYLDDVERMLRVEVVPEAMRSRSTQLFGLGLERRHGERLESLSRNTVDCQGEGQCNFGCPHGRKQPVDVSVLPRALMAGAEIVPDCLVERVRFRGRRAVGVDARLTTGRREHVHVHARDVVLAAGAWHDPLVLRASGLGRHKALGRHMTLHPSFRVMARFAEPVRGWEGALQSAVSKAFMHRGLTLVSLFIPPGIVAATMPGVGPEHVARARQIDHIALFGGLVHDEGGGRVHGLPFMREPIVSYRMARENRAIVPWVIRTMADIFFSAGALECYLPVLGLAPVTPDTIGGVPLERLHGSRFECTSQHPMGTCRMGADPGRSVIDGDGRPWDTEGLWVADGSIVPTSLGVNPQVTIMAMALRVARKLLDHPRA
ncbi:MAG: GMC family oxidoreductase [Deltaproteobacteria bacterium]|nr:GMC family oxidoreductase [Deltaproteobacteria bacterium]